MSDYVNKIAPEHGRTSCSDDNLYNAAYGIDDFDGRGRCYRCTLLMAQAKSKIEDAATEAPKAEAMALQLKLAANRLESLALCFEPNTEQRFTASEWGAEARKAHEALEAKIKDGRDNG